MNPAALSPYDRELLAQIERSHVLSFVRGPSMAQMHALQRLLDHGLIERCTAFKLAAPREAEVTS